MMHTRYFPLIITLIVTSFLFATPVFAATADAGIDQLVMAGEVVILNGANSSGNSYVWTEGSLVLSNDVSFSKKFTSGVHVITLNVTGSINDTDTDSVTVTVNIAPVADAGNDKTITKDTIVAFDAGGSTDEIGGIVSYEWNEEGTVLSTSSKFSKKFTDGIHTITLKVTDKHGAYDTDTIKITVAIPPVANAGPDRIVYEGTRIVLDGSNSTDADGYIDSYKWAKGSEIYNTAPSFEKVFPIGIHTITLTVTDDDGAIGADTVTIEVLKLDKAPPIADAGEDIVVDAGEYVTLNASGSSDRDGRIMKYTWTQDKDVLSEAVSFKKIFDIGKHTVTLSVTDNDGLKGDDTLIVTVLGPNVAPIAKAGPDFNVLHGDYVNLDASQSSDPDGTIVIYEWREKGKLLSSSASFRNRMDVGVHHIELTVTDDKGDISTDTVIVTVYPPSPSPQTDSDKDGTPIIILFIIIVLLILATVGVVMIIPERVYKVARGNRQIRRPDKPVRMESRTRVSDSGSGTHEGASDRTNTSGRHYNMQDSQENAQNSVRRADMPASLPASPDIASVTSAKTVRQPQKTVINITDSTTGLPIMNAKVSIGQDTHNTDKSGNIILKEVLADMLSIRVTARLYSDCTQTMPLSSTIRLELVPLQLITPEHEHAMSSVKKGIDESYRSIMTYDRCIPSFYRSIVYTHIKLLQEIKTSQFARSELEPNDVIDTLIAKIGLIAQRISNAMTSKRIIDIYSASQSSMECKVSDIDIDKINKMVSDPAGYYEAGYLAVQRRLNDVDSQITLMSRKMSVIPLSSLLTIAKEILECDAKTQLEYAVCVLVADNILDNIVEMYNNEHIISRLKLGVL